MLASEATEADGAPAPEEIAPKLLALPKQDNRVNSLGNTTEEAIVARAEKVYELREQGKSYKTIGEELGISTATAHRDSKMILRMKYAGLIEKDETILVDQNNKIDLMLEKWIKVALEEFSVGEVKTNRRGEDYDIALKDWESSSIATDKVIKLMEHQAKINGVIATGSSKQDKLPGEIGAEMAMGVLAAFQKMYDKTHTIKAEVIEQ